MSACPCGKCGSYREHVASIGVLAAALPTRKRGIVSTNKKEDQWQKDLPAYKRMRRQGLQPASVDGSAELESRAETQFEVESGRFNFTKEDRKKIQEGQELSQSLGISRPAKGS